MKNPLQVACKIVVLFFMLAFGSCIKDKCGKVICFNKGVCVDGQCACPSGYEGSYCDTTWYGKFVGVWQADETFIRDTSGTHFKYELNVLPHAGFADSFLLAGLSDSFKNLICYRTSRFEFEFKNDQKFDSITLKNGRGVLDTVNNVISGLYTFRINGYMYARISTEVSGYPARSEKYQMDRKWIDTTITANFKWRQE